MIFLDYKHHCQQFVELGGKNQEKMGEGGGRMSEKLLFFLVLTLRKLVSAFKLTTALQRMLGWFPINETAEPSLNFI